MQSHAVYGELVRRIEDKIAFSKRHAMVFSSIYYVSKSLIIMFALFASVKGITVLESGSPIFSLAVAILTGADTLFKPGAHWKSHDLFNEDYMMYKSELIAIGEENLTALDKFRKRLDELDRKYGKERF